MLNDNEIRWILDYILWLILYSFSSLHNLWPEDGPAEGPKRVVSLKRQRDLVEF